MPEIFSYLTEFGFAALVTVYLLIRMEKRMENLTESINKLSHNIQKIDK